MSRHDRPVFKRDLLIVAEDGNLYHLTEAEYKANPLPVEKGCEARKMIARGMTLGALIPDDLGIVEASHERACCGVCFVVNLSALQHFSDGAMNPDNRAQVAPARSPKRGCDEG